MNVQQIEKKTSAQRLGATAFVLLLLEACGKLELNEEILYSLAYMVQSQMKPTCYPRMTWSIRANFLYSEQIAKGLWLARKQGLIVHAPSVVLTPMGRRHCALLDESVNACRFDLMQATVATIGLSRDNLHRFCIAAAALSCGLAEKVADPEIRVLLQRHAQYATQYAPLIRT
jgi:hypothetical protein